MNAESNRPSWIPLADEALKRAALRARDVAIQTNTGIVVMIDGKMVTIGADQLRAERDNGGQSPGSSEAVSSRTFPTSIGVQSDCLREEGLDF